MSSPQKKSKGPRLGPGCCVAAVALPVFVGMAIWLGSSSPPRSVPARYGALKLAPALPNPIARLLNTPPPAERREGVAAAILFDTSGSMKDSVTEPGGVQLVKIEAARQAAREAVARCDRFAKAHPEQAVWVGLYEFSECPHRRPSCRVVVPLGPPNLPDSEKAIYRMAPGGGTPIGDALITAKRDLDATGFSRLHILVITDGMSNRGYALGDVVDALMAQPEQQRASLYFIAFDIAAQRFASLREAGVFLMGASNAAELSRTLDYILTGKILVEQPEPPGARKE